MTEGSRSPSTAAESRALPTEGLVHLGVVYLIWGSTFLGIRLTVRPGAGFPPFTMGATRLVVAAGLLLLLALMRGRQIRPTWRDLAVMAGSGILLWGFGNGLVVWAEQRAESGLAALMIGSVPMWAALMESAWDRRMPSRQLVGSLLLGFMGVALLAAPVLEVGVEADALSVIALLCGAVTWSAGTVLQGRRKVDMSMTVNSAYQQLAGGLWMFAAARFLGEPRAAPTAAAWIAWLYLILFGGLAFTSYVQVLRILPINLAMTHAYVNPVIAVFLGWLILGEAITPWTVGGAALVLLGVAGVFRDRWARSRRGQRST